MLRNSIQYYKFIYGSKLVDFNHINDDKFEENFYSTVFEIKNRIKMNKRFSWEHKDDFEE